MCSKISLFEDNVTILMQQDIAFEANATIYMKQDIALKPMPRCICSNTSLLKTMYMRQDIAFEDNATMYMQQDIAFGIVFKGDIVLICRTFLTADIFSLLFCNSKLQVNVQVRDFERSAANGRRKNVLRVYFLVRLSVLGKVVVYLLQAGGQLFKWTGVQSHKFFFILSCIL